MKLEYDWLDCMEAKLTLIDKIKMLFLRKQFTRECGNGFVIEHTYKTYKNKIYVIKELVYKDKVVE